MKRVTVSLEEPQLDTLDEIQEEENIDSRSEALRELFRRYEELNQEYETLHNQYEESEQKLKKVLEQQEEHTELVEYVQDERTAEQRWREAGIGKRLKWKIFGMETDNEDED